jgi:hypothetical protein
VPTRFRDEREQRVEVAVDVEQADGLGVDAQLRPRPLLGELLERGFTHPRYTDMLVVATEADEALARLRDYVPPAHLHLAAEPR